MSENNYGALMMKSAIGASDDINAIVQPGIYIIPPANTSSPDATGGVLTVHSGTPILRTFTSDSVICLTSTRNNNAWSAWRGPLSRTNPFADIKADGSAAIAEALSNLGIGKTDSPEFGGLKAPSITLRDGKISLTSSTDGTTLVFTVSGEPVAEIKAGSFFHKKIISAGEVLQSPKYIFRDGDIIFYSGPNNLVMQVGGNDVATLTPENFYHVKQVAAAESLSAPKVILRPGDVNLVSGKNNLVTQAGGNDVATLTPDSFYHVKQVAAAESLKAPKVILRDGDVNLISGANNLVIQVGGNDIASLTPGNNFFKGKLTAETSLQVGSTCILATDGNLTGSKWGGWLDAFMKDGMSTDGNGLWWDAFSSQLQFRVGDWNIPDAAGGAGTSVTFPKAFKNGCLMVIPIPGDGGSSEQIGSQSYSASGAVLQKGASDKNPRSGKYLAIGY
ncbi:pyocin knob domain-containing protein [Citrobacter freundii]|uniref:pyocin knob domain-containing protein n=4 Tax=Citrobacter freundii TaxID=546 RepID=UPI0028BE6A7A|nr:pyocin knob domain-containing protein [Citrobacter freundii]MDT7065541.1 pyocin knob domain-containing protein [Citrobacter freundii]MDT7080597.1 pyocin knob domain-containing protein [Citrobacter freundii]MDT7105505.1 pyocin knob domain-containing protein [Citrobacter freundii]MDT7111475.1 pyocin knob domain-containing protein [Citrobacter freundii]MDT7120492.1 pyocin knob domain-containing protein [Citrobacter freundii]